MNAARHALSIAMSSLWSNNWRRPVLYVALSWVALAGQPAQAQAASSAASHAAANTQVQTQEAAGVRAITLSAGGVAEIQRQVGVDTEGHATLQVPLAQVDDILKSLLVRDSQGPLAAVSLDGLEPEAEVFGALPFKAADLNSLPRLAAALQGIRVQATSGGRSVEGAVLGVVAEAVQDNGGQGRRNEYLLSVLDDKGQVQSLRLGADSVLSVEDDKVREQLRHASQAAARQRLDDTRTLNLSLTAGPARSADVSYVIAAPVWKTSYRLQTDGNKQGRLQGWAILENASGEDWNQVQLTLTSGAPVVLRQRLHERYWNERPEVPVAIGASARQQTDELAQTKRAAAIAMEARASGARRMAPQAATAMPAPAPMAEGMDALGAQGGAANSANARESLSHVSFTLPQRVDAPKGASLALPLLDDKVSAETLAIYRPGSGVHPTSGLELKNDTKTTLPPGLVTIYDAQGAHAGDAELAGIPAGESRLLFFAEDRKVTVREDTQPQEDITEVVLANGVLTARHVDRRTTQYAIQGASDGPRTVLVEHPRLSGWRFKSPALASETASNYRLRAELDAGASAVIDAVAERVWSEQIALVDAETDALLAWSGRVADESTATRLKTLAETKRQWHAALQQEQVLLQAREEAFANQARIRENLGAVPADSSLGQRYATMLAEQEDRIASLDDELQAARKQSAKLQQLFNQQLLQG